MSSLLFIFTHNEVELVGHTQMQSLGIQITLNFLEDLLKTGAKSRHQIPTGPVQESTLTSASGKSPDFVHATEFNLTIQKHGIETLLGMTNIRPCYKVITSIK